MTQRTDNWSRDWNSSKNPSKQRKYRQNAPLHVKDRLVSANLSPELREELDTRSMSIRTGDRVKVMRGDKKESEGIVNRIDREEEVVYIDGIENERADGSKQQKAFRPSNLQLVALNVENVERIDKYDYDDIASIEVDEEELEEALAEDEEEEMMQQMQAGESGAHEQYEEDEEEEETENEDELEDSGEESSEEASTETDIDYEDIVSGTISDAKDRLEEIDGVEYQDVLEAEKSNKNRKTFVEWIENQVED